MRVALVHYWLVSMRGGEKVLEALCEMYPQADIYTHAYNPENISPVIRRHQVKTTFIGRLPHVNKYYPYYLGLMPYALEQLDLRGYDMVISSESGPAKGVITDPECLHICYCHTPMRYIWDMYHDYMDRAGILTRIVMPWLFHRMRLWDVASANRVDVFVANSSFVADRIRKIYRRDAHVVPPPVELDGFPQQESIAEYYLVLGELVGYKRVDLAVEVFNRLGSPLIIIGSGEVESKLRKLAQPNIQFLSHQPTAAVKRYLSACRALIFPGKEDFGIVPVEAMAAGRPVIAYGAGGVLDTLVDGETGVLFSEQSAAGLESAVRRFETLSEDHFAPELLRARSERFSKDVFKRSIRKVIEDLIEHKPSLVEGPGHE